MDRKVASPQPSAPARARLAGALQNALLIIASLALSAGCGEMVFRVWSGQPVLELRNYRAAHAVNAVQGGSAEYDPQLGWRQAAYHASDDFNTIEFGIRKNGKTDNAIRSGGALAVGDSFTAGSEVADSGTWPAHLERRIAVPVINAAVGGYGTDQIVLRAEALLPVVRPKTLLIGMLESDIERSGYSSYGRPKPYFTVGPAGLVQHNVPVPLPDPNRASTPWWKTILGYSLIVDTAMFAIDGPGWAAPGKQEYVRIAIDEADVTCRLLQRLKQTTDRDGIRTLLVMQHGGDVIRQFDAPRAPALRVEACARAMGIQVVDEFESLKAVYRRNPEELKGYYVMSNGRYGHMSSRGNDNVAALIAAALNEPQVAGKAGGYANDAFEPGDGNNLLPMSERVDGLIGANETATLARAESGATGPREVRLAAVGAKSEHYVGLPEIAAGPGAYTLSLEARSAGTACLRLQLLDRAQNGLVADFNLQDGNVGTTQLNRGRDARAGNEAAADGWRRLWMSVRLSEDNPRILLQLADGICATEFAPTGEAVLLRAIQLEHGQSASRYQATSGLAATGFVRGDGINRIAQAEALDRAVAPTEIATLARTRTAGLAPAFRLSATGPKGEHYVVLNDVAVEPGSYMLSLEARPASSSRLRLQILGGATEASIGDVDLDAGTGTAVSHGTAVKSDLDIAPLHSGWRPLALATTLRTGPVRIILQVMDANGAGSFAANGEAIDLRTVRLERSQSSTAN